MGRTNRRRKNSKKNEYSYKVDTDTTIIQLIKTLKTMNWHNPTHLHLRNFPLTGRGVASRKTLQENEIMIQIPLNCMITLQTLTKNTFRFLKSGTTLPMQSLLALFLCIEKHKGPQSTWKFYLDSLPVSNPLTWLQLTSPEVINMPKHISIQMQAFRTSFERNWGIVLTAINPLIKCPCCGNFYSRGVINADLFAWSYAMINTRAVYIDPTLVQHATTMDFLSDEPNMALCPFLDMFNHSPEACTTPEVITQNGEKLYTLRSYKKHAKHEQIFISYGAHDNVKLFVEYGFFVPHNKFDVWPISFSELCTELRFSARAYKYIIAKKLDQDLYITHTHTLSFNLKAAIFIAIIDDNQQFYRIYTDDYTPDEIDTFQAITTRLMATQLTHLTPKSFSDKMTHNFYEYLINFTSTPQLKQSSTPSSNL